MIKVGSDFSGVGAFDMALKRFNIEHENVFACDIDKYAKQTYLLNHLCNDYYNDVYTRPIPSDSLDVYMTSPPCQAFSLAGKREGENSDKGILFYNSLEFITKNKPRFFIFENVKGLLSDNKGITFQNWCSLLGGKSINGNPNIFSYTDSVPYHIYWQVLNAKDYNIPQNRERVFIVGIRDDADNKFQFSKKEILTKKLKDILEENVDNKYYLSEKTISYVLKRENVYVECKFGFDTCCNLGLLCSDCEDGSNYEMLETEPNILQLGRGFNKGGEKDIFPTITKNAWEQNNFLVGTWRTHKDGQGFRKIKDNNCPTIASRAREDGSGQVVLKNNNRIRRLTPLECFRAMDFNEDFIEKTIESKLISDSQLYKQAGNSICVGVLEKIIKNLPL